MPAQSRGFQNSRISRQPRLVIMPLVAALSGLPHGCLIRPDARCGILALAEAVPPCIAALFPRWPLLNCLGHEVGQQAPDDKGQQGHCFGERHRDARRILGPGVTVHVRRPPHAFELVAGVAE